MNNELFSQPFQKRLKLWVPLAFITAVVIIIAGSLLKYDEIDFKSHEVSSTAEVIGFTEQGYPVFSYLVDGKEYKVRSRVQIPGAAIGSEVEILYHSGKPSNVQIGENPIYQMALPMIFFGCLGALVTGYFLLRRKIK